MSYSTFSNGTPSFLSFESSFQQLTGVALKWHCAPATQRLLTYAIKDTVSVLYWYEKLSRNGKFFVKIFESFFFFVVVCFFALLPLFVRARHRQCHGCGPPRYAINAPFFDQRVRLQKIRPQWASQDVGAAPNRPPLTKKAWCCCVPVRAACVTLSFGVVLANANV